MTSIARVLRDWLGADSVRRQGSNALWMLAARAGWIATAATVGIYVARRLGPHDFGVFHYALSLAGIFSIVASLSVESIVIRKLVNEPDARRRTLGSFTALRLLSFLLMGALLLTTLLVLRIDSQTTVLALVIASGNFGLVLEGPALFYQAKVASKHVAIPQLLACLVNSGIRISAAYWHLPLIVLGIAEASINILSFGGALFFYWRAVESPFRWQPDRREVVSLLRLALPLGLSGIFTMVDARIDNLMLGHFLGPDAVGQYSVAARVVENWNLIAALLATAFLPALLKAKQDSAEHYRAYLHRLYFSLFYGMAALAIATAVVSTPVITLLFGEAFRPAASVLRVLVWSTLGATISYVYSHWAINEQRTSMVASAVGIGVLAKIALNLLLVRRFQSLGVAFATVLACPIGIIATTLPTRHGCRHLALMLRSLATLPRFRPDA